MLLGGATCAMIPEEVADPPPFPELANGREGGADLNLVRSIPYTLSAWLKLVRNGIKSKSSWSFKSSNHEATGT